MACLDGEGLEESDADADDTHGHTATNQQQKAHAKAQADLCHNEPAVGGVETVDGVMPAHCWECGQDEGHHPDAHHSVHCLLLGVAQPETQPQILGQVSRAGRILIKTGFGSIFVIQVSKVLILVEVCKFNNKRKKPKKGLTHITGIF